MKSPTRILLGMVFLVCVACSNRSKNPEAKINELLPPDTLADAPRDYSKDVIREDGQFSFNALLSTDLKIDLKLYDGSSVPSQQLSADIVAANFRTDIPANAIIILKNAISKKVLFTGSTDAKGRLEAKFQVPAQTKDAILCVIKSRYVERNVLIEDIARYSKIERGMGIVQSQDSIVSNNLTDSDGDLVPDYYDAYPADTARAFRYSIPADDFFTVAFEDNFPSLGDGDYNDFLAQYRVERISNSSNEIVEITGEARAMARLAGYDHRFGILINFPGKSGSLQVTKKNHLGVITGTQSAVATGKANVVLFERTQQAFNNDKGYSTYFRIVFSAPVTVESVDAAPYDPYLYIHNTGYDVHLLGKPALPNSSNPPGSNGFRDANGFPRALLVPAQWPFPKEGKFIETAYPKFLPWRQSNGQQNSDWFLFPVEAHTTAAANEFADRPGVLLPAGYNPALLQFTFEGIALPDKLGGSYVPVGKVYNITMTNGQNNFGADFARIEYSYNGAALQAAGLTEEFQVFFYDTADTQWKPVQRIIVDTTMQKVTAFSNHFTPFVLTAAPTAGGTVPAPPACINDDFPSGIGGSGTAKFSLIDENFKYYQDRNYFIQPITTPSPENAATFGDLGFEGAMGISTCNGAPPGSCGAQANHKLYSGTNYINFTAHMNLDVYVMYDTRGGGNRNNTSFDAAWLTAKGFTVDIKGNGGTAPDYFVQTTDAVQYYAVYKKTYAQGEVVALDGNRLGAGDPAINTNYWVIVKPAGNLLPNSASALCVAAPDTNPPAKVFNLQAIPGATKVTLRWQNPVDPDFAGVIIRRSTAAAPADINEGVEAIPNTVFSPESFRDDGVAAATTYFYTVFALDNNHNRQLGESIMVVTGADGDGDGLANAYENAVIYATGLKTSPTLADTDGDGISDGIEVANATDPTNADTTRPAVVNFTATSPATVSNPNVSFNLIASDNAAISGYMITMSATPPLASNTGWSGSVNSFTIPAVAGTYALYAWVKDAAGNVSMAYLPLSFTFAPYVPPIVASRVYGQRGSFSSGAQSITPEALLAPRGIAIDATGIYIADHSFNRVLHYSDDSIVPDRVYGQTSLTTINPDPATNSAATLVRPIAIALDATGVYIVDEGNSRVLHYSGTSTIADRVYGQQGDFTTGLANKGGISASSLSQPTGVAVDATGVYIADARNHRVLHYSGISTIADRVYGQTGSFATAIPNRGGTSADSLWVPTCVTVDAAGVYICDINNHRILHYPGASTTADRVYGQSGSFTTGTQNSGPPTAHTLKAPIGAAVSATGLYIADAVNSRVLYFPGTSIVPDRVYGQAGNFNTANQNNNAVSADTLLFPYGIAASGSDVYIADTDKRRVLHFTGTSTTADRVYGQAGSFTSSVLITDPESLNFPGAVIADTDGCYIVDSAHHRVLHFAGSSTYPDRVYGQGGNLWGQEANYGGVSAGSLVGPNGMAVDSTGVYITDPNNNRVLHYSGTSTIADRVYGQQGDFTTGIANKGGLGPDGLSQPRGVASDATGVYIADYGNHRVLHYSGISTTADRVYGQANFNEAILYLGNGSISANTLFYPMRLAADASGLYVVDGGSRVLHYSGISTTADRVYGQLGSFNTYDSNKGGISADSLFMPSAVAMDVSGVYISDFNNHRVLHYPGISTTADRVYGQLGSFTTGDRNKGGTSAASLSEPSGVSVDPDGKVYISELGNHRVLFY